MTEIDLLKALVEQLTGERDRLLDDIERYRQDIAALRRSPLPSVGPDRIQGAVGLGGGGGGGDGSHYEKWLREQNTTDAAGPTMTGITHIGHTFLDTRYGGERVDWQRTSTVRPMTGSSGGTDGGGAAGGWKITDVGTAK